MSDPAPVRHSASLDSLPQTQRQGWSRPVDARRRVRVGNVFDVNGASRAGHRDKLLSGATDEFALRIASGLAECVQSCRASKGCWTGQARRAGWADATACTVRATWTGWTGWTGWARRTAYVGARRPR